MLPVRGSLPSDRGNRFGDENLRWETLQGRRQNANFRGTAGAGSEVAERESALRRRHEAVALQLSASRLPLRSARRFQGSGFSPDSEGAGLPQDSQG
jgi:hypothetical protein